MRERLCPRGWWAWNGLPRAVGTALSAGALRHRAGFGAATGLVYHAQQQQECWIQVLVGSGGIYALCGAAVSACGKVARSGLLLCRWIKESAGFSGWAQGRGEASSSPRALQDVMTGRPHRH